MNITQHCTNTEEQHFHWTAVPVKKTADSNLCRLFRVTLTLKDPTVGNVFTIDEPHI